MNLKLPSDRFMITWKIILYALPILAFVGITISLIFGQFNLSLLGTYLAVPMFFAPIVYLKYCKSPCKIVYSDSRIFSLLMIFYFLCFSISIILLAMFEVRPIAYYLMVTFMASSILFEILLFDISHKKTAIILFQIMILFLNIVWSENLKYYYFIGNTDKLAHVWYIKNLMNYGYITDVFFQYKSFPLWHIMVSSLYMILDISIPVHKMMFFMNGLNYSFMMLTVYLASLKIFKNKKLALLSSLFTMVNVDVIFYGMSSISRSVASFLEVMLILLMLDNSENLDPKKAFLMIFLTFAIIAYHPASIIFIISILLIIYILQKFYGIERKFLNMNYLLLTIIMTLTYYIFFADNIFKMLIGNIVNPADVGIMTKSIVYTPLNELFNYLQYVPLLFFVIIGILWILKSKRFSGSAKVFGMTGLLLVTVSFPGPALLINKLAANFNLSRFAEYSFFLISTVGAVGFAGIYYRSRKKLKIFILILFIVMSFLAVSNDFVASDNPLVKRTYYTSYLIKEEIVAFNQIANIADGYIMSDYVTYRYFEFSPYESKSHLLEIDPINMKFLRNNISDVLLIREQELNKRPLKMFPSKTGEFILNISDSTTVTDYYGHDSPLWNTLEKYNKIYNSGGISGFN